MARLCFLPETNRARSSEALSILPIPGASPLLPLLVGAATIPFLGVILGTRLAQPQLAQWGAWSEELFRGERLPTLPLRP